MKKYLFILLPFVFLLSCKDKVPEKKLTLDQMKQELADYSSVAVQSLPVMENYVDAGKNTFEGFCVPVDSEDFANITFVKDKRLTYKRSGYLLFLFENNERVKHLAIIKTNDEFDIVRWRGTDGINYGHTNKDIIEKLKQWNEQNPLNVMEVGLDLVWIQFEKPVLDMDIKAFGEDVYSFCPDVIDQGAGDMPTLLRTIADMNGIYLWWD